MAGHYFRRGKSKVHWLPSVADVTAPTLLEIQAGQAITRDLNDITDISVAATLLETPDYDSGFTSKTPGPDEIGDPTLVYWDRDNSDVNRLALAKGTDGFLLLSPYGLVSGKRCEVYPSESTGVNDQWNADQAAQFQVKLAVTAPPEQNAVLPAGL